MIACTNAQHLVEVKLIKKNKFADQIWDKTGQNWVQN